MELSVYVVEKLAAMRLDDLRAECARIGLLDASRGPRPGVAAGLGATLIRLGRWLAPGDPVAGGNAGVRVAR